MTDALVLAARLRVLDDAALATLVRDRRVDAARIADLFDLADALLAPDAVARALEQLDRTALAVLAVAAEEGATTAPVSLGAVRDSLARRSGEDQLDPAELTDAARRAADTLLAGVDDTGITTHPEVAAALAAWPAAGLPGTDELARLAPPAPLAAVPRVDPDEVDRRAGESAFRSVVAVAALVDELSREPARELSRGGMSLPDARRLAAALGADLDDVPAYLSLADRATLVARSDRAWSTTTTSAAWSARPTAERWEALAAAWLEALAPATRGILAERAEASWGAGLVDSVLWRFPGGSAWIGERITAFTRDAGLLGISTGDVPSSAGRALLTTGAGAAATALAPHLPAEVDRVYLQHDLTVVSPGPLDPAVESRLLEVADAEGRGLAATYRISASSVTRALATGATADAIRALLAEISLTGIPQPLDYLLDEAAARFGRLRVRPASPSDAVPDARSAIVSDDGPLLATLLVDRDLAPLRLVRAGDAVLTSAASPDAVERALAAARLAPVREDAAGHRIAPAPRTAPASSTAADPEPDAADALVSRVRAADGPDDGAAWTTRQLEVAIRAKAALRVRVRMPDGREVDHVLEPSSVAGGRLRARDRVADVERTLPLSSVVEISPAPASA
ncbi:helicase-associated domain-containing protein [Clavibacter sp. VKM Ac-2542]|uniref:helicase-associated domain-containing protein n=1 Tax=Clavibacter sp. VKM Ac-2542 TaxID=2783811 RepID=UPI00188C3590|nr:helicase-associated domain-containing protein [Clavibacter sp. VKM Ac-2542]MBF4622515.1 helicase-associated domain-containing protein [Clavibacter sp. VKM Ac-2542]